MQAVVFEEFGGPEVLRTEDVAEPHAGPGEVRVSVRAAGVNPIDFKIRRGWTQGFMDVTFPATPGGEVAGVVDEVGEGAGFAVGDEVVGWSKTGAYAEYAVSDNVEHRVDPLRCGRADPVEQALAVRDRDRADLAKEVVVRGRRPGPERIRSRPRQGRRTAVKAMVTRPAGSYSRPHDQHLVRGGVAVCEWAQACRACVRLRGAV